MASSSVAPVISCVTRGHAVYRPADPRRPGPCRSRRLETEDEPVGPRAIEIRDLQPHAATRPVVRTRGTVTELRVVDPAGRDPSARSIRPSPAVQGPRIGRGPSGRDREHQQQPGADAGQQGERERLYERSQRDAVRHGAWARDRSEPSKPHEADPIRNGAVNVGAHAGGDIPRVGPVAAATARRTGRLQSSSRALTADREPARTRSGPDGRCAARARGLVATTDTRRRPHPAAAPRTDRRSPDDARGDRRRAPRVAIGHDRSRRRQLERANRGVDPGHLDRARRRCAMAVARGAANLVGGSHPGHAGLACGAATTWSSTSSRTSAAICSRG